MDMKPVMSTSLETLTDIFILAFIPLLACVNNEPKNNIFQPGIVAHTFLDTYLYRHVPPSTQEAEVGGQPGLHRRLNPLKKRGGFQN